MTNFQKDLPKINERAMFSCEKCTVSKAPSKIDVKQLSISNKECDLNALIDNLQKEFSIQLEDKEVNLKVKKEFGFCFSE